MEKEKQADSGGFCRRRTRMQLKNLALAALLLLVGICVGIVFVMKLEEDRSDWDASAYVEFAAAGVLGLAALVWAFCEAYVALRDALFPEKSRLAKSIRSQLPYPDEAPLVKELFAMVDQDIQKDGKWFDRAAVGKEWLLGDEASLLSRVRAVFGRNESHVTHHGGRTQTQRIIQLYVMDDRRQVQITDLRKPNELDPLLDCLKLRCPDALFLPYNEYSHYRAKSEEEWQALLREYNARKFRREEAEQQASRPAEELDFEQTDLSGATAAFSVEDLGLAEEERTTLERLRYVLSLSEQNGTTRSYRTPTHQDVLLAAEGLSDGKYTAVYLGSGRLYIYLQAGTPEDGRVTVNVGWPEADGIRVCETKCTERQAREHLLSYADGQRPEGLYNWKDITKKLEKQRKKETSKRN